MFLVFGVADFFEGGGDGVAHDFVELFDVGEVVVAFCDPFAFSGALFEALGGELGEDSTGWTF